MEELKKKQTEKKNVSPDAKSENSKSFLQDIEQGKIDALAIDEEIEEVLQENELAEQEAEDILDKQQYADELAEQEAEDILDKQQYEDELTEREIESQIVEQQVNDDIAEQEIAEENS